MSRHKTWRSLRLRVLPYQKAEAEDTRVGEGVEAVIGNELLLLCSSIALGCLSPKPSTMAQPNYRIVLLV